MVKGSQHSPGEDKKRNRVDMTGDKVDSEQVQILSNNILHRVHVDSIQVTTRGGFLSMVVLVDVRIQPPDMQKVVEPHVKVVIECIEGNQRPQCVSHGQL